MGTASGVFYTKQAAAMTAAHYANNGNIIFDTIKNAGMLPVSHDIIPGQCDRLVTAATENPKDVVVTLSAAAWVGDRNTAMKGMKVFRHPTLGFYLRVEIHETGGSSSSYGPNSQALTVQYKLALEINASGELVNPQTFFPRGGQNYGWSYGHNLNNNEGYGYGFAKQLNLKVSVGADHFCLGHTKDMQTYETGYVISSASNQASCGPCLLGISTCSIAIMKSAESPDLFVLIPRNIAGSTSYPNEINANQYNEVEMGLPRQYRIDAVTGNLSNLGNAFFSALQLGVVSDTKGIRAAQIMTTAADRLISLPLVTIHAGAVEDNAVVTLDVDGNGPRQYFAVYGLGVSTWHPARFPVAKHPVYLFPWGD